MIQRLKLQLGIRIFSTLPVVQGWYDAFRLRLQLPGLRGYRSFQLIDSLELAQAHQAYISTVSSPRWAVSLETSRFMVFLCTVLKPASILDLGSGFSSLAFRWYQRQADGDNCRVVSVDEDSEWLLKTRQFCDSLSLGDAYFLTLSDFTQREPQKYDLIFYDLTPTMDRRASKLHLVQRYAHERTIAILDDVHYGYYHSAVRKWVKENRFQGYSLRHYTLDFIGRYAMLVCAFRPNTL